MTEARGKSVQVAETVAAIGLILLRTLAGVIDPWWTHYPWWVDWILLVAAMWILHANAPPGRSLTWSVYLVMGLLALIYIARQAPFVLLAYGLGS